MWEIKTKDSAKEIIEIFCENKLSGRITFEIYCGGITLIDLHWKEQAEKMAIRLQKLFKEDKK